MMKKLILITFLIKMTNLYSLEVDIQAGARPRALGGAFVAVAEDMHANYWNPAGLVQLIERSVGFVHIRPFSMKEISINMLSYAQPVSIRSGMGVAILHKAATLEESKTGELIDKTKFYEDTVIFSLGTELSRRLAFGLSLKYLSAVAEKEKSKVSGFSMCFGLLYKKEEADITFGAVVKDAISLGLYETLPMQFRIGLAKYLFDRRLLISSDINTKKGVEGKRGTSYFLHLGGEYKIANYFRVRVGLDRRDISCGIGVDYKKWQFDYAFYKDNKYLRYSHQLSCSFNY